MKVKIQKTENALMKKQGFYYLEIRYFFKMRERTNNYDQIVT